MNARPWVVRLYATLLALLPRQLRFEDGEDMERIFAEMWDRAARSGGRFGCTLRSFAGLFAVIAVEWTEELHWLRAGRALRPRDSSIRSAPPCTPSRSVRAASCALRCSPGAACSCWGSASAR